MSDLIQYQKRFLFALSSDKKHWEKLKALVFSVDAEQVVLGMNLLENVAEEVYFDGICTWLRDDGWGNWYLEDDLGYQNKLMLQLEIIRVAEENIGHEIKEAFSKGCFDKMLMSACEHVSFSTLEETVQNRLVGKVQEMVPIQVGTFVMGEGSSEHQVLLIQDLYVMKYPVTQGLWEVVMGSKPSRFKGATRPVEKVRWFDCVLFANKLSEIEGLEKVYQIPEGLEEACAKKRGNLDGFSQGIQMDMQADGYRFLTEAEWEYVAKGGKDKLYAGSNYVDKVGWYDGNSKEQTQAVGQKKPNGYGVYDMSGNVWEWVWDWYGDYQGDETNPLGPKTGVCRVFRGGGWSCEEAYLRVGSRGNHIPDGRNDRLGFRLGRVKKI